MFGTRVIAYYRPGFQTFLQIIVHFHLVVTDQCTLCCSYCRGRIFDYPEPESIPTGIAVDTDLPVDLDTLYAFLAKD